MERLSRLIADHRRSLCAVLTGLAVLFALAALTESPATTRVEVAAHDLPSGHRLAADDIRVIEVPDDAAVAHPAEEIAGRQVAGPMRAGEPFTDRRVIDPRSLDEGTVLASVVVEPEVAALVRPGDRVDVLAIADGADDDELTLATAASVLLIEEGDAGTAVGIQAAPEAAAAIARAALVGRLTLVHSLE
ncbi:SAF domain-containing protein [Aeromicrobium piscarium]|uniref:SAF domain-containing protein n=1 Tax=Aeromicrobium piscarium TaxID=2590901 RepID=A0A554SPV2_9ACTN|nr:SAF domain-containing protein [Aeromicrobium piscarium]TSD68382.1 hypothetical protein FNM00_01970 [Aeromicrobium piscarium]